MIYLCPSKGWKGGLGGCLGFFSFLIWTSLDWETFLYSCVIFRRGGSAALQGTEHSSLPFCCGTSADQPRTRRCPQPGFRHWVRPPPPQGCSTHSFYHPAPPPCLQPEQRCAHLLAEYWESWEGWWGCNWWGCLGVNWQAVVSGEPSSLASSGTSTLVIMNPSLDFSLIVTPDTCKWAFFFPLWLVVFYCNIVS